MRMFEKLLYINIISGYLIRQVLAWQHDRSQRAALHVSEVRVDNCINIVTDQLKCQTASINNEPPHALWPQGLSLAEGDTTS